MQHIKRSNWHYNSRKQSASKSKRICIGGVNLCVRENERQAATHGRHQVGGSGGHSGLGGGGGVPECFGKEGPHHSVAGEKQSATQQPQRDVKLEHNIIANGDLAAFLCEFKFRRTLVNLTTFFVSCVRF